MKTRIIENKPSGTYTDDFIAKNPEVVKDWEFAPLYEGSFINPLWNGTEWVESATIEELQALEDKKTIAFLKAFMVQKKIDGENYYSEIELSLIIILKGLPLNDLMFINNEIEEKIKPIINEIKTGDWFNAYMRLHVTEDYIRPSHTFLSQTFDNIKVRVSSYFENNYPRE